LSTVFASGSIEGNTGTDVLRAPFATLSGLTLSGIEILETTGGLVTATAGQFESFDTIRAADGAGLTGRVGLKLVATGAAATAVNLVDELGGLSSLRSITLTGTADNETITTAGGDDVIDAGIGNDTVNSGGGNDQISDITSGAVGENPTTNISADDGNDSVSIGANVYSAGAIDGGNGIDTLRAGNNILTGLTLSNLEILEAFTGHVTARAAQFEVFDTIRVSAADPTSLVTLRLAATGAASVLDLVEELTTGGGQRGANLTGTTDNETITTGGGNDTIDGAGGDDTIDGGAGNDTLRGGAGNNTVSYASATAAVTVNLLRATAQNTLGAGIDTLSGFANFIGSDFDDAVTGDDATNMISGGSGRDTLDGGAGNDTLNGGADADTLIDSFGTATVIDAGAGDDLIVTLSTAFASGSIEGNTGTDVLRALFATLSGLTLSGIEILETTGGLVTATANQFESFDTIRAAAGAGLTGRVGLRLVATGAAATTVNLVDELGGLSSLRSVTLTGTTENETITTAGGDDVITSGAGNDVVFSGGGNDRIIDNQGTTTSVFAENGNDVIDIGGRIFVSSTISGGDGTDTLSVVGNDLTGLTLSNLEVLETRGRTVTARATQFELFDTILADASDPTRAVRLNLVATGLARTANLADELNSGGAPRGVVLNGTTDTETITTGEGSDIVNGAAGNDIITTGGGNDHVVFANDGTKTIRTGTGNDLITLTSVGFFSPLTQGTVDGGDDSDTLVATNRNLTGLALSNIENLHTGGGTVVARASQFDAFDVIRVDGAAGAALAVNLGLAATGAAVVVDLSDELGARGVTLTGTTDDEIVRIGTGASTIDLGAGNDEVVAETSNNTITITDSAGNDIFGTGSGDDTVTDTAGNDGISTGAGNDTITDTAGTVVDISAGDGADVITIDNTSFGSGMIAAGVNGDIDTLNARNVNLSKLALNGFDVLNTGDGNTTGFAAQFAVLTTIRRSATDASGDVRLTLARLGSPATLDLSGALSSGGGVRGVILTGSTDNETITTSDGNDTINLGGGNDSVTTGGGNDTVTDDAGTATTIDTGVGGDTINIVGTAFTSGTIDGGADVDILAASGANLANLTLNRVEILHTGTGTGTVSATASQFEAFTTIRVNASNPLGLVRLTLVATGTATTLNLFSELGATSSAHGVHIEGSADSETLTTSAADDGLYGGGGNDTLSAGNGNDVVDGGTGNDKLFGQSGDDTLVAGAGIDQLTGGGGDDVFYLTNTVTAGRDIVKDFTRGQDHVLLDRTDFSNFDRVGGVPGGAAVSPNAWFRSGTDGLAKDANDRFIYDQLTGKLYYDADGTGSAARQNIATFEGAPALTTADFQVETNPFIFI
jgi:Ca2+-binding RTX toxin-like protein